MRFYAAASSWTPQEATDKHKGNLKSERKERMFLFLIMDMLTHHTPYILKEEKRFNFMTKR